MNDITRSVEEKQQYCEDCAGSLFSTSVFLPLMQYLIVINFLNATFCSIGVKTRTCTKFASLANWLNALDKVRRYFTVWPHAASASLGAGSARMTASVAGGYPSATNQSSGVSVMPLRWSGLLPLWTPRVNTR